MIVWMLLGCRLEESRIDDCRGARAVLQELVVHRSERNFELPEGEWVTIGTQDPLRRVLSSPQIQRFGSAKVAWYTPSSLLCVSDADSSWWMECVHAQTEPGTSVLSLTFFGGCEHSVPQQSVRFP